MIGAIKEVVLLNKQGLSNRNYLLKADKKTYTMRVFGSFPIDRKFEFEVSKMAYEKGIGANPILLDIDNSFMIYEFLDGFHKFKLKRDDIKNIAKLLKRLHQIKIGKRRFNAKKDFVLCHHDLNPRNFIFSKNIKLIDWEYARSDDRYFDLASVVIEFKLNKKEEKLLLDCYFKNRYLIDTKKINFFKIEYIKICKKWFKKRDRITAYREAYTAEYHRSVYNLLLPQRNIDLNFDDDYFRNLSLYII